MIESAQTLMAVVGELDTMSKSMLEVEKELAAIEVEYRIHVEDFKVGMYEDHKESGDRMPAEDVRDALAHQAYNRDRYRRYLTLRAARNRAKGRISDLHEVVAAHRSILSAEKLELEASQGPQPQWSPT